jgi:hypothetical protein
MTPEFKTTETLIPDGRLAIAICPSCGSAQITLPLDEVKRVTVVVDHADLLHLIVGVVEAIGLYREGRLSRDKVFLPAKCCAAEKKH